MFKINMANAKLWKNLIGAISPLVDEASFDLDPEGIKLRAMDPSHVAMVDMGLPKTIFDEYFSDKPTKLCVNIAEMLKLLKRVGGDESIELELDEKSARLTMTLKSNYVRIFSMATLEPLSEEIPTPKISFNSIAKITTDSIRNAVDDISTVSDQIQFEMVDDKFIVHASGTLGSVTIKLDKESDEVLYFEIKEASKAIFSLNYLSEMVKAASNISDIVSIEFSTDMPLGLNFKLPQGGGLQYYLAPRIESV